MNELVREMIILYRENDQPVVDISIRYTLKPGWLLRFDYGHTISNLTANDAREGRVHLGLIVSY